MAGTGRIARGHGHGHGHGHSAATSDSRHGRPWPRTFLSPVHARCLTGLSLQTQTQTRDAPCPARQTSIVNAIHAYLRHTAGQRIDVTHITTDDCVRRRAARVGLRVRGRCAMIVNKQKRLLEIGRCISVSDGTECRPHETPYRDCLTGVPAPLPPPTPNARHPQLRPQPKPQSRARPNDGQSQPARAVITATAANGFGRLANDGGRRGARPRSARAVGAVRPQLHGPPGQLHLPNSGSLSLVSGRPISQGQRQRPLPRADWARLRAWPAAATFGHLLARPSLPAARLTPAMHASAMPLLHNARWAAAMPPSSARMARRVR